MCGGFRSGLPVEYFSAPGLVVLEEEESEDGEDEGKEEKACFEVAEL